ncbi:hypothetical protein F5Y18DRAFT_425076 [Xylariaceae sp. FL1019]|nr:hypothetical protein F5Y18DRAFT_425076 [Xylariaceae sp. FL1019]
MAPKYKEGETVRYKPVGGRASNTSESTGKITDVLTEPGVSTICFDPKTYRRLGRSKVQHITRIGDQNVNASADQPRYEIVNDNTGKMSSIYESNILGRA